MVRVVVTLVTRRAVILVCGRKEQPEVRARVAILAGKNRMSTYQVESIRLGTMVKDSI